MKSALNLDQYADLASLPPAYQSKIKFKTENGKPVAYFPKGCEFDGEHALHLVKTGQASPIDEECAAACGMDANQLASKQMHYAAANVGIKGKKDLEMFLAGAITGYAPGTTDENPIYIHGPNWDAWQAAEAAAKAAEERDTLDDV